MKRQSYKLEGFISELQKFLHQIVGTVKPVQRIRKYGLNKKLIERLLFIEGELLHLNCQHSSKIVNIMTRYYNIMTLKPQPEISSHLVNGTRYCFLLFIILCWRIARICSIPFRQYLVLSFHYNWWNFWD